MSQSGGKCHENERLFLRLDAIFLWRHEVKESLSATIQFVESTITGLVVILATALVEDCKKKGAVMEGAVFDCIVQFRYLDDTESDSRRHMR
jgi:hypothetical protein